MPPAGRRCHDAEWDVFVQDYLDEYFAARPDVAVRAVVTSTTACSDWSARGLRREAERLRGWRADATVFDTAGLDARRRFEREYLIAQADGDLFWLERAGWPYRNPTYYLDALDPEVYVSRPYAPLPVRMRAYVRYARSIPAAAQQIRQNTRTPLPRTYVDRAASAFGGFAEFFTSDVPKVFASVNDRGSRPNSGGRTPTRPRAAQTLGLVRGPTPAGDQTTSPSAPGCSARWSGRPSASTCRSRSWRRVGRADLDRNLRALRAACASYAPGRSLRRVHAPRRRRQAAEGPVEGERRQLVRLRQFIARTTSSRSPAASRRRRRGAAIQPRQPRLHQHPGPYETNLPSTYYIAPPDPAWSAAERAAYVQGEAPLLFVSAHEVWPGHFLQFLHANRSPSKFGQVFVGYAFAEGWAHYAEEMMWDAGLGSRSPEVHIGQLTNALLRNVRYLSAIGLHTGGLTVAESERMFREQAYQDPGAHANSRARHVRPGVPNYTWASS